tara:strand:+ start:420 stop:533 length:114 start_codon:yes stop_codon:yes gene_type:complete
MDHFQIQLSLNGLENIVDFNFVNALSILETAADDDSR